MFDNVMRLEFRKQRQDFLVVVGFATAVLLCFVLEALIRNRNVTEVLKDVLVFVSMGLVLVLALTSANSARNLRTEPYKAAEELLPFSPIQKTLGAYLVNVVYLAAGSSLFLLSVYVFTAERNINWLPLSILLIIHFHLLCFLFSYWLNQTILAVIISGLLVWCESAIIGQKVFFVLFFSDPDLLHKPLHSFWSFLSFVISITGGLVALAIISTRIERQRRVRWMPGILAFIILLSGSFLLFIDLLSSSYTVQKRLMPGEYYYSWIYEVLERSPDHERTGAYFFSLTGSIVRVSPQDRQVLREVPLRFVPKPAQDLINVYEAPDHTGFWTLIKREENKYEIWNSRDGKKLKLYTRFTSKVVKPYYILKCETSLCVYGNKERNIAHAMINTNGLSEWHETEPRNYKLLLVGKIRDEVFEPEIEAGRAAVISSDLRKVTRQLKNGAVQEWVLPGKAEVPRSMGSVLMPAFHKDGEPIFALPVTSDNKTSLVICKSDGSVAPLWNRNWTTNKSIGWRSLDEGHAWVRREPTGWKPVEAFVVGKDGFVYPPLKLPSDADEFYPVDLLKMVKSNLWILTKDSLHIMDLRTGKTLESFKLFDIKPKFYGNVYRARTKEGVYFVKDDRINLIDWNGKVRDLGSARLN